MKANIEINKPTSIINYTLNKFAPTLLVVFLLFTTLGFETWEPYIIVGLMVFSQVFHYKVGYSVAICRERGLLDEE